MTSQTRPVLAIAGGKGGCGKTTTALGLACALGRRGERVLVADADADMPDLHALARTPPAPTLADCAGDRDPTAVASPSPRGDGVAVLPAPTADRPSVAGDLAESADGPAQSCASRQCCDARSLSVDRASHADVRDRTVAGLRAASRADRRCLVDCPCGGGPDAVAPLRVADGVLAVSTPTRTSLADAAKTVAMARQLDTAVVGVAVVRRTDAPDGVRDLLDAPVLGAVPETDGDPLADERVRRAYDRLAARVTGRSVNAGRLGIEHPNGRAAGDGDRHPR